MSESESETETEKLLQTISDETGGQYTPEQVKNVLSRMYDLDVSDLSEDDARKMREAWEDQNVGEIVEVLQDNDVPDDLIQQFRDMAEESMEPAEPADDAEPASGSASGESVTRDEVREMIAKETPSAREIADEIKRDMGGGPQGGAAAAGAQGGSGGADMDPQQQMALKLVTEYLSGGGGGQAAKLGEKFQEKALESAMQRMFAPDPFDIARQQWAKKHADKLADDEEIQEMMGLNMFEEDDGDDDTDDEKSEGGSFWNF